jgi:hypothetical protein
LGKCRVKRWRWVGIRGWREWWWNFRRMMSSTSRLNRSKVLFSCLLQRLWKN